VNGIVHEGGVCGRHDQTHFIHNCLSRDATIANTIESTRSRAARWEAACGSACIGCRDVKLHHRAAQWLSGDGSCISPISIQCHGDGLESATVDGIEER
jgi:hypothetical protein